MIRRAGAPSRDHRGPREQHVRPGTTRAAVRRELRGDHRADEDCELALALG